uniref:adenylate cyclase type 10-like n=1 Tax=Pristiophorus japonicus TaxID=55135 RepID=UPI00398F816A
MAQPADLLMVMEAFENEKLPVTAARSGPGPARICTVLDRAYLRLPTTPSISDDDQGPPSTTTPGEQMSIRPGDRVITPLVAAGLQLLQRRRAFNSSSSGEPTPPAAAGLQLHQRWWAFNTSSGGGCTTPQAGLQLLQRRQAFTPRRRLDLSFPTAAKQHYRCLKAEVHQKTLDLKNRRWMEKAQEIQQLADSRDVRGFFIAVRAIYNPNTQGLALRPFDECVDFINRVIDDPIIKSEKNLMLTLHSSVALWYCRLSDWNRARSSFKVAKRLIPHTNASLFSMYGYSKFLECQILVFRKALWERQETVMEVYQQTKEYLQEFKQRCNTSPVFFPRLFHLKAYCYILAGQVGHATHLLDRALDFSKTHGNILEENWIKTSRDAWFMDESEEELENLWVKSAKNMPIWDEVTSASPNSRYLLQTVRSMNDFVIDENVSPTKSEADLVCIPY